MCDDDRFVGLVHPDCGLRFGGDLWVDTTLNTSWCNADLNVRSTDMKDDLPWNVCDGMPGPLWEGFSYCEVNRRRNWCDLPRGLPRG